MPSATVSSAHKRARPQRARGAAHLRQAVDLAGYARARGGLLLARHVQAAVGAVPHEHHREPRRAADLVGQLRRLPAQLVEPLRGDRAAWRCVRCARERQRAGVGGGAG